MFIHDIASFNAGFFMPGNSVGIFFYCAIQAVIGGVLDWRCSNLKGHAYVYSKYVYYWHLVAQLYSCYLLLM